MAIETSPITLNEKERDIVLYAKDMERKSGDVLGDIRGIVARFCAIHANDVPNATVYEDVLYVFFKVTPRDSQERFWQEIFFRNQKPSITREELVPHLLGRIAICQVRKGDAILIDLGD